LVSVSSGVLIVLFLDACFLPFLFLVGEHTAYVRLFKGIEVEVGVELEHGAVPCKLEKVSASEMAIVVARLFPRKWKELNAEGALNQLEFVRSVPRQPNAGLYNRLKLIGEPFPKCPK
jgi:hypothetical protein